MLFTILSELKKKNHRSSQKMQKNAALRSNTHSKLKKKKTCSKLQIEENLQADEGHLPKKKKLLF